MLKKTLHETMVWLNVFEKTLSMDCTIRGLRVLHKMIPSEHFRSKFHHGIVVVATLLMHHVICMFNEK